MSTRVPGIEVAPPKELPPSAAHTLDNGLTVLAVRRPSVPLVELRLQIPFAYAPQGEALLLAQTITDGTAELGAPQVAERLDLLGARMGVSVDADRLVLAGNAFATATSTRRRRSGWCSG